MSNASSKAAQLAPSKPSSKKSDWNPWWYVLFVIGVFFAAQLLAGLLVSIYPFLKHWSISQANNWLTNSVPAEFFYVLLAEGLTVGAIILFLRRRRQSLASIGLRRPRWSDPLFGLAGVLPYFILYLIAVSIVSLFFHNLNVNQQQQLGFNNVSGAWQLILTFISLVVLPPIAEEILVRGFLYKYLKKALPKFWAVIATSALFAAAHLPEGGSAGPLYIAAVDTFVLSLVLIYLREKTGGLYASMTLHAIKNGVAFTALFALHVH